MCEVFFRLPSLLRHLLPNALVLTFLFALPGCACLTDFLGRRYTGDPSDFPAKLSPAAQALVTQAFTGLVPGRFADLHVHMIGTEVNPTWREGFHPYTQLRAGIFLAAAGITDIEHIEQQHVARMVAQARAGPITCRLFLYALDRFYRPDGTPDPALTNYYVSNDSVLQLARQYPDVFVPVASIHPYRSDALAELERCADQGVRYLKWLPNCQGMDPADPRNDPFYAAMRRRGMVLLCHTGSEGALDVPGMEYLGNPLRLRRPLDAGVTVVALHCGGKISFPDLDHPDRPDQEGLELFRRLVAEPRYRELLYGDLAAEDFVDHPTRLMATLIADTSLHPRLLNGSDYPLSAAPVIIWLSRFESAGMLTSQESSCLVEIGHYNPLLFDFILKRTLRDPQSGTRLPPSVFMIPPELPLPPILPSPAPA